MPPTVLRSIKTRSKSLLRSAFVAGQRFRVDVLPRHFYSEIPDISQLQATRSWRRPRSFTGIRGSIDEQAAWVEECTAPYRSQLQGFSIHANAVKMNGSDEGYGLVEADFLYCFVRAQKPKRIMQIGCGVSTAVCLMAARDEGYEPKIVCIEPYPTEFLQGEQKEGRIELMRVKAQDATPDCVQELQAGDLFFVDSSHTLAPAGELNLIILEMLPQLAAGVYVHFHDIHFPYDYAPNTLSTALFFPHETALLYAFLAMNPDFEIKGSLSMLHHRRPADMLRFFPEIQPTVFEDGLAVKPGHFPSATYLQRVQDSIGTRA